MTTIYLCHLILRTHHANTVATATHKVYNIAMKNSMSSYYTNNLSYADCVATIADSGFDGIMIKWQDSHHGSKESLVKHSRAHHLDIVNMHCDYDDINSIWTGGTHKTAHLLDCVNNCHYYGIDTLVVHLSSTTTPPSMNMLGIQALAPVVELADKLQIQLALENLRKPQYNKYVHQHFDSQYVGVCYDCGHENIYCKDYDILQYLAKPIFTTHLHDNDGITDTHQLPMTGSVQWHKVAQKLAHIGQQYINIESRMDNHQHNYTRYLSTALQRANDIQQMVLSIK